MKRFTETNKWGDGWFRKLKSTTKLFFLWLLDNSDCAGVCDIDHELAEFQIGEKLDIPSILDELKRDVIKLDNGKVWTPKSVFFQCGALDENCPPHKGVIKALSKHNLLKEYSYPIARVSKEYGYLQEKEQEQEKEKDNSSSLNERNIQNILSYANISGIPQETAKAFWNHFEASGWIDKNGNKVCKWKPKLMSWWLREQNDRSERNHHLKPKKEIDYAKGF